MPAFLDRSDGPTWSSEKPRKDRVLHCPGPGRGRSSRIPPSSRLPREGTCLGHIERSVQGANGINPCFTPARSLEAWTTASAPNLSAEPSGVRGGRAECTDSVTRETAERSAGETLVQLKRSSNWNVRPDHVEPVQGRFPLDGGRDRACSSGRMESWPSTRVRESPSGSQDTHRSSEGFDLDSGRPGP